MCEINKSLKEAILSYLDKTDFKIGERLNYDYDKATFIEAVLNTIAELSEQHGIFEPIMYTSLISMLSISVHPSQIPETLIKVFPSYLNLHNEIACDSLCYSISSKVDPTKVTRFD